MSKFTVWFESREHYCVDVEAGSHEEATAKAEALLRPNPGAHWLCSDPVGLAKSEEIPDDEPCGLISSRHYR